MAVVSKGCELSRYGETYEIPGFWKLKQKQLKFPNKRFGMDERKQGSHQVIMVLNKLGYTRTT